MQEETKVLENAPFEFGGNGSDFFKIWFVNVVLTVITLGIYGAWAKVRNNQYIYGNTYLGGHAFEYTADPIRILIGRLIVVGFYIFFIVTYTLGYYEAAIAIYLIFMLLIPLLIRQALVFRAKYTRFHGLNFRYKASVGAIYKFFLLHTFLNIITLFIILPYTHSEFKKLVINNTYYGESNFSFKGAAGEFFFIYYVKMLLLSLVFIVPLALFFVLAQSTDSTAAILFLVFFLAVGYILMPAFSFILKGAFDAWIGRAVYNSTSIKEYKMLNEWDVLKLSWIYFSNFVAIMFTIGLMYPWAKIRDVKYKLENTGFEELNLNVFIGEVEKNRSALGEEAADFFDFDIGF